MHEKLFHFLSIKISAKLNDEYRKMPLILSLSHIVDEQQQNRQYKKSAERIFAVWKNPSTPIYCLFVCAMHNGENSIAFLFLILLLLPLQWKRKSISFGRWYNMCLDFSLLNIVTNRFSELCWAVCKHFIVQCVCDL